MNTTTMDQAALWNGRAGQAWVDGQEMLDRMFDAIEARLVAAVGARGARHVLDVGCGTGSTTIAIAGVLSPEGGAVGVDISQPMLALAEARATHAGSRASFVCGSAETHPFDAAAFDMIVSRFGVMFFDDPVRAFANLRRAARDGATLECIVWRSPTDNPFMTTAERAAAPLLPSLPPRRPDAPGQFALADPQRARHVLEASGWTEIDVAPLDVPCVFPEAQLLHYVTRMGPLGMALESVEPQLRDQLVGVVRAAFEPFVHGAEVRFTAACWEVKARAIGGATAPIPSSIP